MLALKELAELAIELAIEELAVLALEELTMLLIELATELLPMLAIEVLAVLAVKELAAASVAFFNSSSLLRSTSVAFMMPKILFSILSLKTDKQLALLATARLQHPYDIIKMASAIEMLAELLIALAFESPSGDVSALAWLPTRRMFAAGSVALNDESSMQHNKPLNLLLENDSRLLRELPEHHLPRPRVLDGVNSLHSMQES